MNRLFNNMLPYEVILTIMGMIIFLALVFLLIWSVMKKRPFKALLAFFLVPVIMVAYPTIKSINIGNAISINTGNVKEATQAVTNHPGDTAAVAQLKEAVVQLKATGRTEQNGKALLAIANAQIALGRYDSASLYLKKAAKVTTETPEIDSLQRVLTTKIKMREDFSKSIQILKDQMDQLKHAPGDTGYVHKIAYTLSDMEVPGYVHSNELVTLAKSLAIVGSQQQSLAIIKKLDTTTTEAGYINALKDSIERHTYQKQFFKRTTPPKIIIPHNQLNRKILNHTIIRKLK